jgi:PAS domain S-box-containing protein
MEIPVEISSQVVERGQGPVIQSFVRDISERKRSVLSLRESEERFQRLSQATFEGIAISDEGRIVDANSQLAKMLGYAQSEMVGKEAMDFVALESRDLVLGKILSRDEGPYEHYALRKDGTTFPVEVQAKAFPYEGRQLRVTAIRDISERKRVEEQITLQSTALKATANAIMITNDEGRIIWVNPAFCSLTGYLAEEVLSGQPSMLKSGKQDPDYYRELWQTIRAGRVWHGRLINKRKDGSEYIDEQTITPLLNDRGQVTHFIAIKQDVSERVRAEVELRKLKELNEGIVLNAQEGITIQDNDGHFTLVNPAIARLLGYEPDELVGRHWSTIVPESLRPVVEAADERRNQGEMDRYELQLIGKDGKARPVLVSGAPWYEDGCIVGTMAVFTDISERVQRERERDIIVKVAVALRKARNRAEMLPIILSQLLELFGTTAAALSLRDSESDETVIELGMGAWAWATGRRWPPGEGVSGHVIATGRPYVNNDMRSESPYFSAELLGGIPRVACVPLIAHEQAIGALLVGCQEAFSEVEVRLLTALGDMAASAIQRSTLLEQTQQHASELEQRVAERTRALAEANVRLQELDRLKAKFISDVSHELRTPITNLNLYMDLLTRGKPDQRARYMVVLKREAGRLGRLVEDILSLSRLEMGRDRELKFSAVNLNEIVSQVIATHRPKAEAAELTLSFVPSKTAPMVEGERNQIAQVVTHLVSNAISYTRKGGIRVQTSLEAERGQGRLTVEDTGMGIESEDLVHLFERFYRGQRTGQSDIPGTGLGLAIVREIVDLHEGRIEVESALEKGSLFSVWLPLAAGKPTGAGLP